MGRRRNRSLHPHGHHHEAASTCPRIRSASISRQNRPATRAASSTTSLSKTLRGASGEGDQLGRRTAAGARRAREGVRGTTGETQRLGEALRRTGAAGQRAGARITTGLRRSGRGATTLMTRVRGVRTELGLARTAGLGLGRAMALAGGAFAAGSAVGRVATMETRLARLGIQARQPTEAMTALRERIADVANAPAIKLDPSELLAAVEAIVEKTGDLQFAEDNLQTLAEAIQGAGSTGDAMGRLAAELRKVGVVETDEVAASLNLVTAQGKTGAFTIGHMARQGERLFSAFARLGATGPDAVRQLGAIAQVARQATGGPEQAATTIEALIRGLTDAVTLEKIADIGVRVRKDDGSYRDLDQIPDRDRHRHWRRCGGPV